MNNLAYKNGLLSVVEEPQVTTNGMDDVWVGPGVRWPEETESTRGSMASRESLSNSAGASTSRNSPYAKLCELWRSASTAGGLKSLP